MPMPTGKFSFFEESVKISVVGVGAAVDGEVGAVRGGSSANRSVGAGVVVVGVGVAVDGEVGAVRGSSSAGRSVGAVVAVVEAGSDEEVGFVPDRKRDRYSRAVEMASSLDSISIFNLDIFPGWMMVFNLFW